MRLLALWLAIVASAMAQDSAPSETGLISGVVVNSVTGAPLRKAYVSLTGGDSNKSATKVSGSDGSFMFTGLGENDYAIKIQLPGFADFNTDLPLDAGQKRTDLRIALRPYGAISGRVVDADSDPWPWGHAALYQLEWTNGKRRLEQVTDQELDDRGGFRIPKLAAGRYYLSAEPSSMRDSAPPMVPYQPTWYPGALDVGAALPIRLQEGQEAMGFEIRLQSRATYHVHGKVTGLPPAGQRKWERPPFIDMEDISAAGFQAWRTFGATLAADGSFEVRDVPSGSFKIAVLVWDSSGGLTNTLPCGTTTVEVGDRDVEGVAVPFTAPRPLRGKVVVEGQPAADLSKLAVYAVDLETDSGLLYTIPRADGSFEWPQAPVGRSFIGVRNLPPRLYLKSVRSQGVDLPDEIVDTASLKEDALEMVLHAGAGQIDGKLQAADTENHDITVLLAPDESDPARRERGAQEADVDFDRSFTFFNLRPGAYRLFAWQNLPEDAWKDPEFWLAMESKGVRIEIGESEEREVDLTLISPAETAELLARLDIL
ncbi:MAG: carboxypeptidase regulatory-like domain-containing protein [Bryobacteraceae bacterium]|jgi:hypothetical protein